MINATLAQSRYNPELSVQNDSKAALINVMTSLTGGDLERAEREIGQFNRVFDGDIGRHVVLIDLQNPDPGVLRLEARFGHHATLMFQRFTAAGCETLIEGELALFRITSSGGSALSNSGMVLQMHRHAIDCIAAADFPDQSFTPVELRIIFLMVAGYELRELAAIDEVGYETRRGQLKTIMSKLHLSRQAELVRMFLGRLLVQIGGPESEPLDTPHQIFFDTMNRPGLERARPFVLTGRNGRQIRVVEMGPKTGQPVIVLHPMVFPVTTTTEVAAFHEHGIRALWPIREGALSGPAAPLGPTQQLQSSLEDIALLHEMFCDGPVTLLGLMSGATHAIEAARRMPTRIGALGLVGACYRPRTDGLASGALRRGLFSLARNNPGIMMAALRLVAERISRPASYKRLINQHYHSSPADLAVIEQGLRDGSLESLLQRLSISLGSLRNDFFLQADFNWSLLRELQQPVHFIHGAEDPIHPAAGIRSLLGQLPHARLAIMEGAGQLLLQQHFGRALALAAQIPQPVATPAPARARAVRHR